MVRDVALLAEGVDRNFVPNRIVWDDFKSPSSRRAWIEINYSGGSNAEAESPSSRRAWIEMAWSSLSSGTKGVALLAEGVDRNLEIPGQAAVQAGRPPRWVLFFWFVQFAISIHALREEGDQFL